MEASSQSSSSSGSPTGSCGIACPTMDDVKAALERAKFIVLNPTTCWDTIAAEPTTVKNIYVKYAILLAAIPAICGLVGGLWFRPLGGVLVSTVIMYIVSLAVLYVDALVIQFISPKFGGSGDLMGALKLTTYSLTPVWLAGVLQVVPLLGILGIAFMIYAVYLFAQGPTKVLAIPDAKRISFVVVSILAIIAVQIVIGIVVGAVLLGTAFL